MLLPIEKSSLNDHLEGGLQAISEFCKRCLGFSSRTGGDASLYAVSLNSNKIVNGTALVILFLENKFFN